MGKQDNKSTKMSSEESELKQSSSNKESKSRVNASTMKYSLVMIGAPATGKSCITIRFIAGRFVDWYEPTIEESYRKVIDFEDDNLPSVVDIFDTAGTDDFRMVRDAYIREADGFVCVYSISDMSTLEEIPKLVEYVRRCKGCALMNSAEEPPLPMILVGNKCDLPQSERAVSTDLAKSIQKKLGIPAFLEASAREGININKIFYEVVRQIRNQKQKDVKPPLEQTSPKKKHEKCIIL